MEFIKNLFRREAAKEQAKKEIKVGDVVKVFSQEGKARQGNVREVKANSVVVSVLKEGSASDRDPDETIMDHDYEEIEVPTEKVEKVNFEL